MRFFVTTPLRKPGVIRANWRIPPRYRSSEFAPLTAPFGGYTLQYRIVNSTSAYKEQFLANDTTSAEISGLNLGTAYEFRLAAATAICDYTYLTEYTRTFNGECDSTYIQWNPSIFQTPDLRTPIYY